MLYCYYINFNLKNEMKILAIGECDKCCYIKKYNTSLQQHICDHQKHIFYL